MSSERHTFNVQNVVLLVHFLNKGECLSIGKNFKIKLFLKSGQNLNEQTNCESFIFNNCRLFYFVIVYVLSCLDTKMTALKMSKH